MKKILFSLISSLMFIMLSLQSFAISDAQYGLEAKVYNTKENKDIVFNVRLENVNTYDVDGVSVACTLPKELTATDTLEKKVGTIKAGEAVSVRFSASNFVLTPMALKTSENNFENNFPLMYVIFGICGLLAIAAIIIFALKKRTRKIIALMLCVVLLIPVMGGFLTFAADSDNFFDCFEEFEYDGKKYIAKFTISIADKHRTDSGIISCINNDTVTDATQDIEGTVSSDEKIKAMSYKVYSEIDEGEVSFEGDVKLDGAHYKISDTVLKPESNRIDLTCTTVSGKKFTKSVNIKYDSSSLYEPKKNEISHDKKTGRKYINSIVNILFKNNVTEKQKQEITNSIDGEKVGYINGVNMWQIKVPTATLDKLNGICDSLNKSPNISNAYIDFLELQLDQIPNDPWAGASWNENSPEGKNWNLEMMKCLSAYDYDEYFHDIRLGILDSGCYYNHEDLNGRILFTSTEQKNGCHSQDHGTHVAGIMTATPNNGIGMSGIAWHSKAYMFDINFPEDAEAMTLSRCYEGFVREVESGAKVINMSVGLSGNYTTTAIDVDTINENAKTAASKMEPLLKNHDFIVCQSAGNGNKSSVAVNTEMNGMFCSVNQNNTGYSADIAKKINDRIIVSGSMDVSNTQSVTSNYGDNVDVASPGVAVYSTVTSGYNTLSGTSMASPTSAAVLGVIWSVNPELTGSEVTDIFLRTAKNYKMATASATGQTLKPVPNLKTAVEEAIKTLKVADCTLLDEALELVPDELSKFTPESIAVLNDAKQAALSINRKTVKQNEVDRITDNLYNAIYALQVKFAPKYVFTTPLILPMGSRETKSVTFECQGATDISISFDKNITAGAQVGTDNSASILVSGQSVETNGIITCTVNYTYDGMQYSNVRYIRTANFTEPVVCSTIKRTNQTYFYDKDKRTTITYNNPSLYTYTTIKGTSVAENPQANANNGYFDFNNNSFVKCSTGTNWGGYNIIGSSASNSNPTTNVPKGYVFVNPDKYDDLSAIDTLQLCVAQYAQNTNAYGGTKITDISSTDSKYSVNIGTDVNLSNSVIAVNPPRYYPISGPVPTSTTTVRFAVTIVAYANNDNVYTTAKNYIDLVIIPLNIEKLVNKLECFNNSTIQSQFYTDSTYSDFMGSYRDAYNTLFNRSITKLDIDLAYDNLVYSYYNLEYLGNASYTDLDNIIASVDNIDSSKYTNSSMNKLYGLCGSANAMSREYFSSYQVKIDKYYNDIQSAISNLILCGDMNKDGVLDGNDAVIVRMIISGMLHEDDLGADLYEAANVNKDTVINETDFNILFNKGLIK